MGLSFPSSARCSIPGCRAPVTHCFSIRMRREDSGADWAPNHPAYFCTPHACDGAKVTVLYEPNQSGAVDVSLVATKTVTERTTRIGRRNGVMV